MNIYTNGGALRIFHKNKSLIEASFSRKFGLTIEFPSDWHEDGTGTIHIGLLFFQLFIHFPWYKTYEDNYQCSGPEFGAMLSDAGWSESFHLTLWLYYGNSDGTTKGNRMKIIYGPWDWGSAKVSKKIGEEEIHKYLYTLKSGEKQERKATIQREYREWRRFWLPWKMVRNSINIDFDDEVGERSGSWKGGTVGCGYDIESGETMLACLRRMEKERTF